MHLPNAKEETSSDDGIKLLWNKMTDSLMVQPALIQSCGYRVNLVLSLVCNGG